MLLWDCVHIALTREGQCATEPLVDHNAERILIACQYCFRLELFRGHIDPGASDFLLGVGGRILSHQRNPKVGDLYASILCQKEVGRFEVTVNDPLIVGTLEASSDLADIGNDRRECQRGSRGACLSREPPDAYDITM